MLFFTKNPRIDFFKLKVPLLVNFMGRNMSSDKYFPRIHLNAPRFPLLKANDLVFQHIELSLMAVRDQLRPEITNVVAFVRFP
jgi:hypothetical protein